MSEIIRRRPPEAAFLTPDEIHPLVAAGKIGPQDNIGWREVRSTQLSVARFAGGAKVNGVEYEYIYDTDELVRRDVARLIRAARKARRAANAAAQPDLLAEEKP